MNELCVDCVNREFCMSNDYFIDNNNNTKLPMSFALVLW